MTVKIDKQPAKEGPRHRIRLFVRGRCVHTISPKDLEGLTLKQVRAIAREMVTLYQNTFGASDERGDDSTTERVAPGDDLVQLVQEDDSDFNFERAKTRFLAMIQAELNASRRAHYEVYFRDTVIPFFIKQQGCPDPREWPPLFDVFKGWLRHRRRRDGRKGSIKMPTANRHIDAVNRFIGFCDKAYGFHVGVRCKKFGKKEILSQQHAANGGEVPDPAIWGEEEFAAFREAAYARAPRVAPIFDLAFGLGLRRGEAIGLRVDAVHLDDDRMGEFGYVEIIRQYTWDDGCKASVLKPPKWGRTRVIPIPYPWLKDALHNQIHGRVPASPGDNAPALRSLVKRYPNTVIAKALGVSETAVRKWLVRHRIERRMLVVWPDLDEAAIREIRDSLLWRQGDLKAEDFVFADGRERLPDPGGIGKLFLELIGKVGLKRIRFHDLRHSFGSLWADRVPPAILKAWMGHASITTTERYVHTNDEMFRRWVSAVQRERP